MKKVLLFSAVLFFAWLCSCDLCAQTATCQPNPACKAVCAAGKSHAKGAAATPFTGVEQTGTAVFASATQPGTPAGPVAKTASCDPTKCDPTKCDLSKCDPAKCDPSKCLPASCTGAGHKTKL